MAPRRRPLKTLPDASRDLLSELPVEVKDRILECLSTRDAARTALLSRHWNDVWLQHERLTFDSEFVQSFQQSQDDEGRTLVNMINNIIFSRAGPVKKFTLEINAECDPSPSPQQSDIDRWCLFLSRNGVEELNLSLYTDVEKYKLPFCLLSCRTIKKLIVRDPFINLPVNDCGIFSNVTSLAFFNVVFNRSVNGIASSISIPKLEKLALEDCGGINKFEISPPKLEILSVIGSINSFVHSRWLVPYLKAIKTLWLCGSSLECMRVSMFPTAITLRVLKLYDLNFDYRKQLIVFIGLLQKCSNLCELHIMAFGSEDDNELNDAASRLLEDRIGCLFIQELHMLNTIKIEAFNDQSELEMLFMKTLLSKSPTLERVVIVKSWRRNASEVVRNIQRKLECFPRASPNAQIVCTCNDNARMSEDWMDTHGVRLLARLRYL